MDSSLSKASPFPPANDVPLQRNPPLAPSQEMAYRNKCVQLKRRLTEIEANNDATRRRIATEKERVTKQRLLRAILLNQLKEIMETPGSKLTPDRLKELGITEDPKEPPKSKAIETLLDDSSDNSDDEELPEPGERPTRTRRTNNNYRESIMNTSAGTPSQYQTTGLPHLAPANPYSSTAARDAGGLTSSFHVGSTPIAADSPPQSYGGPQYGADSRYSQHSSPIQHHQNTYQDSAANGLSPIQQPVRPKPPIEQFREHMRPQLVADNYPPEQIESRIDAEWAKLSYDNRALWEQRYEEQMNDYTTQMTEWARAKRRGETDGGARGGFTALNTR